MTTDAARERLKATHEQIYGTRPLDLDERTTLEDIRMNRDTVRDNVKKRHPKLSPSKIERRTNVIMWLRGAPLMFVKAAAGIGFGLAADELKDRAAKAIKRL